MDQFVAAVVGAMVGGGLSMLGAWLAVQSQAKKASASDRQHRLERAAARLLSAAFTTMFEARVFATKRSSLLGTLLRGGSLQSSLSTALRDATEARTEICFVGNSEVLEVADEILDEISKMVTDATREGPLAPGTWERHANDLSELGTRLKQMTSAHLVIPDFGSA